MQPLVVETYSEEKKTEVERENNGKNPEDKVSETGQVRLCRNFVELLYLTSSVEGSTLEEPTTKFDDCGFLGGDSGV